MKEYLIKISNWVLLCFIAGVTLLLIFANNTLFLAEGVYYQTFGEQLAISRIEVILENIQKWQWLGYVFVPIVVLIRISFTTICLYTGAFVANVKVGFKDLFKVALLADFVFVLAGVAKLVILIFFKEVSVLDDLQFQPLSLMELFDRKVVDPLLVYPLSLINVFELLYWLVLAWLLTTIIEKPMGKSFKLVASSYGVGILFWVVFVMFLTVNLSQ